MFQCFAWYELNYWIVKWWVLDSQPARGLRYSLCCWTSVWTLIHPVIPASGLYGAATHTHRITHTHTPHHTHDPHFSTCDSDVAYEWLNGQGTQGTTLLSLASLYLFNRLMICFGPSCIRYERSPHRSDVLHLSRTTICTLNLNAKVLDITNFYICDIKVIDCSSEKLISMHMLTELHSKNCWVSCQSHDFS